MRRPFILRPEPGASETAGRALALGLDPVLAPLFTIVPTAWEAPDPAAFDGLLLTSANAVHFGGESLGTLSDLPVHAVGEATAGAARQAGFAVETVGAGGVDELLRLLPTSARLLHLCGAEARPATAIQEIAAIAVYSAEPSNQPPDLNALRGQVALIHSPRAASRLAELVEQPQRRTVRIAAISIAAAEAAGEGWQSVDAAPLPTDAALLALAARLCDNGG